MLDGGQRKPGWGSLQVLRLGSQACFDHSSSVHGGQVGPGAPSRVSLSYLRNGSNHRRNPRMTAKYEGKGGIHFHGRIKLHHSAAVQS